jgi:hypothetical protein
MMMMSVRSARWLALAALVAFAPAVAGAQGRASAPGQMKKGSPVSAVVPSTMTPEGAIQGVFDIVGFYEADGQIWASGVFTGTLGGQPLSTAARAPLLLDQGGFGALGQHTGACPILLLELGPIHLDLLGLVVDVSPITVEIVAQPGPGNLLGNLLCAVVGLLDGPGALVQRLQQLVTLLNAIIGLLS